MIRIRKVALVFKTRLEENQRILSTISKYNRFRENWSAFVDDQAVSQQDPEWLLKQDWDGIITRHSTPELVQACIERAIHRYALYRRQIRGGGPAHHQK